MPSSAATSPSTASDGISESTVIGFSFFSRRTNSAPEMCAITMRESAVFASSLEARARTARRLAKNWSEPLRTIAS